MYADPESYQFIISKKKRVDRTLDVYYVGVMDPITQRPWSFSIGTPRCFVTFQTSQFENDAPNTRALVCPMYGDGQNPNTEPFLVFVNHLSALSDALKQRFVDMRCDVRDWMSPIQEENGFIIGVPVKVKSDHVRQVVINGGSNVVCCLKIICVYFCQQKERSEFGTFGLCTFFLTILLLCYDKIECCKTFNRLISFFSLRV